MSLLQYLSQRLLILGGLISVGIFYIIYVMYQWGLDDSTEYYLTQDMQWAIEILGNNKILPSNTKFRQFYLRDSAGKSLTSLDLPQKYSSLILSIEKSEFFFLEGDKTFQYGLHQKLNDSRELTVIHQFAIEDTTEGTSLLEISIVSSLALILIMLLGSGVIYQRISLSMQQLMHASKNEYLQVVVEDEFVEINEIMASLKNALEALENKNDQERLFIQTLSHELRTPMATVQVALELLAKKDLTENVRDKIDIIFNSNQRMQVLSNELLSLWSNTENTDADTNSREKIHLQYELSEVIADLDRAFDCKQRFIINSCLAEDEMIELKTCRFHLSLLLNNVCKNAIVHSEGEVNIVIASNDIKITNYKSHKDIDPLVAGSGIGLILATKAVELLNWKIGIIETDTEFELTLTFKR